MKKTFFCIDGHTCGNPVRVIAGGAPELKGKSIQDKRKHFIAEFDWIRKGLMFEPRGHDMMSGSILYPPENPNNDFAILFIETSGCLPMCGHGSIGSITIAIEEGLITPKCPGKISMETPAGIVQAIYQQTGDKVDWVRLTNVKSYLAAENLSITCPELGKIYFDVAYGGNYYAIIDPQKNYKGVENYTAAKLIQYSRIIRSAITKKYPDNFIHPEDTTIKDVSHILWTGKTVQEDSSGRNAVFYGDKAIDRSPCGTGTSARMAQLYTKKLLSLKEDFIHESYIGSKFIGKVTQETTVGKYKGIVPSIQGWARVYSHNTITIDTEDPYAYGFQVI